MSRDSGKWAEDFRSDLNCTFEVAGLLPEMAGHFLWLDPLSVTSRLREPLAYRSDVMTTIRTLRWSLLVPLFSVILRLSLVGQTEDTHTLQIAAALREEQYDRALQLLHVALEKSPADPELWTMQGYALKGVGNTKDALVSFKHALKLHPDNIPALQGAAQIQFNQGDAAGVPILERLLKLHPDDLTSHAMIAALEYQQGNCIAALPHFKRAEPVFETRPAGMKAYATCLVKQKQFDNAIGILGKTLEGNPDDRNERRVLAAVQLMSQHPEDAIITLTPLLSGKADTQTLELASQAYEQSRHTEKAVDSLREAILNDPMDVNLYMDFAAISERHQSVQTGINVVNDGIALQPNAAALYFARGMLYVQLSDYEKAQSDFDRAYKLDPKASLTAAAQGLTAVQQNDFSSALAGIQDKLRARPNDPILLYMQADVLTEQDPQPGTTEFNTAMSSAKKAVSLNPSLGPAHTVLAKLYMAADKYPEAASECRKALENDPSDQTALYHLVRALRKTDQKGQIPELLNQLAALRQQAAHRKREENRFKLVEGESQLQ
jgi:tetratricopeptide (TPR) repeat protein